MTVGKELESTDNDVLGVHQVGIRLILTNRWRRLTKELKLKFVGPMNRLEAT